MKHLLPVDAGMKHQGFNEKYCLKLKPRFNNKESIHPSMNITKGNITASKQSLLQSYFPAIRPIKPNLEGDNKAQNWSIAYGPASADFSVKGKQHDASIRGQIKSAASLN